MPDGTGIEYASGSTLVMNQNTTLYAQWFFPFFGNVDYTVNSDNLNISASHNDAGKLLSVKTINQNFVGYDSKDVGCTFQFEI